MHLRFSCGSLVRGDWRRTTKGRSKAEVGGARSSRKKKKTGPLLLSPLSLSLFFSFLLSPRARLFRTKDAGARLHAASVCYGTPSHGVPARGCARCAQDGASECDVWRCAREENVDDAKPRPAQFSCLAVDLAVPQSVEAAVSRFARRVHLLGVARERMTQVLPYRLEGIFVEGRMT